MFWSVGNLFKFYGHDLIWSIQILEKRRSIRDRPIAHPRKKNKCDFLPCDNKAQTSCKAIVHRHFMQCNNAQIVGGLLSYACVMWYPLRCSKSHTWSHLIGDKNFTKKCENLLSHNCTKITEQFLLWEYILILQVKNIFLKKIHFIVK